MSYICFCGESVFQHQDADDAQDRQEEESEEELCYRTYLHNRMQRDQTQCLNERQQRWEEEVTSQGQHDKAAVEEEASDMGVALGEWGKVINYYDHLAQSYQRNVWVSQDLFFILKTSGYVSDVSVMCLMCLMNAVCAMLTKKHSRKGQIIITKSLTVQSWQSSEVKQRKDTQAAGTGRCNGEGPKAACKPMRNVRGMVSRSRSAKRHSQCHLLAPQKRQGRGRSEL